KSNLFKVGGIIAGGLLLLIIVAAVKQANLQIVNNKMLTQTPIGSIKVLGMVLYTDYILPFEVASILFLIAMVGAVILGRREHAQLSIGGKGLEDGVSTKSQSEAKKKELQTSN